MYLYSDRLIECFHHWRHLSLTYYSEDTNLALHTNLIAGLLLTSGILENICSHWKVLVLHWNSTLLSEHTLKKQGYSGTSPTPSIWATYWWTTEYNRFTHLIPYNFPLSLALYVFNKWCLYAWNFGDIFIAVISRALYKRFQLHHQAAQIALQMQLIRMKEKREKGEADFSHNTSNHSISTYIFWKHLVKDHDKLMDLLKTFSDLLSPLIFWSVCANVYFVGTTLYNILESTSTSTAVTLPGNPTQNQNSTNVGGFYFEGVELADYLFLHRIYVAWACLHLFIRMMITLVCGAKVNEYAHKTSDILARCPVPCWTTEVERMNLRLRTSTVGLTGLNYFTLTKPFILRVFNVIFTVEIVLLQSSNLR